MPPKKPAGSRDWTDPDDAPALTEAFFADAEIFDGGRFVGRARGRPKSGAAKEQISVRLDPDVLAKLREAGPGSQTQINALLREALGVAKPAGGSEWLEAHVLIANFFAGRLCYDGGMTF